MMDGMVEIYSGRQFFKESAKASSTGRILIPAARSFETSMTQLERGVWAAK